MKNKGMLTRGFACLLIWSSCLLPTLAAQAASTPQEASAAAAQKGLESGIQWLLEAQEPNGAFGHWRNPEHAFWSTPSTHLAWQVATTGLSAISLMEYGGSKKERAALHAAMDYLAASAVVKRPNDWDTDNTWAFVYGLEALTRAASHSEFRDDASKVLGFRKTGESLMRKLWAYQSPQGGWAYYADETKAVRPWWATSFQTAVAVMAIFRAQDLGWEVDTERLNKAIEGLKRCRLKNGAYSYSMELFPTPGGLTGIDQTKGSLSRIQVCNAALFIAAGRGYETGIGQKELRKGLQQFWGEHRFLDLSRRKPVPHEAYHYNSGYFYFFGHYYAAEVISLLPLAERAPHFQKLQHHILKTQEKDGSCWDYPMHSFAKPYAVAYATTALVWSLAK
ncbi:MAG: hypothetical protein HN405_09520 [Planctomycetes bacterium]|jgi:hypothetical protein|nr:hypothetical protein [Planctomycetota bacterium]MBT4028610.1 hypothetical protein [Planctomycetota bacterium]MBT4559502.1 hypothetical protein [Planctomycetota bacterium]MBT7012658.1 hypothetical protein [Planctomycetota bacterium]